MRNVHVLSLGCLLWFFLPNVTVFGAETAWSARDGQVLIAMEDIPDFDSVVAFSSPAGQAAESSASQILIDGESAQSLLYDPDARSIRLPAGLALTGPVTIAVGELTAQIKKPSLRVFHGKSTVYAIVDLADAMQMAPLLELVSSKAGVDQVSAAFFLESANLTITSSLADRLGEPRLSGLTIGSFSGRWSLEWLSGEWLAIDLATEIQAASLDPVDEANTIAGGNSGTICSQPGGPDVIVGDLSDLTNYAAISGIEAFAVGTTSCNVGNQNLLWVAGTNQHPVIGQSMFRLKNGRFEQIGQSWLKHGFTALTENLCGCHNGSALICPGPGGSVLGVGCSDPYCCGLNGSQGGLGPRYQVNAYTGNFTYPFATQGQTGNSIFKRLQVRISDLDSAQQGGGQYFVEGQYVTPDDAAVGNHFNNASYRPVTITGAGNAWSASLTGTTQRERPVIRAWKANDPTVVETDVFVPGEGLMILAAKATDLGGGNWQYEYALQNLNSERGAASFRVPKGSTVVASQLGFHDVDYHSGEPFDGTDWAPLIETTAVSWSTQLHSQNANANSLRWGTLYNFRFQANSPPATVTSTIGYFKPPGETGFPSINASTLGPASFADCNANSVPDNCDISCGVMGGACDVAGCGLSEDCDGNLVPDNCQPDCNTNSVADTCDITSGNSQDCNGNMIPDECESFPTTPLGVVRIASGFTQPIYVTSPPGDANRLFVVEQDGRIKILNLGTFTVNATPFLNISSLVSTGGERGLLGLAFHPNFAVNRYLYVNYTNAIGNTVVARYTASAANPDVVDPGSITLKTITQDFANHNGGCLQFGPDGMLYVGMGDGGSSNDPNQRAQDPNSLLGKMLRLNVDVPSPFVPADNPFVGVGAPLDEILHFGLRNPWRFSFDRLTGDMYIGDVGQSLREEISFVPGDAATTSLNFGWRCMEATLCTNLAGCTCNDPAFTLPIAESLHNTGAPCYSITGGYTYRGCEIPDLSGTYFYSDYCENYIRSFRYDGTVVSQFTDRTAELTPAGGAIVAIVSFGEDAAGEMYIVSYTGSIYKIVSASALPICGNGAIELGESCDDGNLISGDGCGPSCQVEPAADLCADAPPICPGNRSGSTSGAGIDGASSCGAPNSASDVWYRYIPATSGSVTVDTCSGSAFDTVLSIHTACPGSAANEIVCSNDGCATNRSTVTFLAAAGTPYIIRVSGAGVAAGNFTLTLTGPDCLQCPQVLFEDHFESDFGWTVSNISITGGAWERGFPAGDGSRFDPTNDFDGGGRCYLTENGPGNTDVDGGPTTLISPVFDGGSGELTMSYAYWFSRDDAEGDDTLLVEVSNNSGADWSTLAVHNQSLSAWQANNVLIDAIVQASSTMQVRFSATDSPNNSVLECAIDAVIITSPCGADCNENGIPDDVDISSGTSLDCNLNDAPDECDLAGGISFDCAGGPVGVIDAGEAIITSTCFGCHDVDGTGGPGFPGPNLRNKSRVQIWNKLLPPTTHPGGAHPEYNQQNFADLEAFLADAGGKGRPDEIPDECASHPDCDADLTPDACELQSGTQLDLNHDGLPDACTPPVCNSISAVAEGGRYIKVAASPGTGRIAFRVTGESGDENVYCVDWFVQADGSIDPALAYRTAGSWSTSLVTGPEVFPDTTYTIKGVCPWGESNSVPVVTSPYGDVDQTGIVDVDDLICIVEGFSGEFMLCSFEELNIAPCQPNFIIDLDDVLGVLDGFAQVPFGCASPCP